MNPLIAIATAVLPDILKAVIGDRSEKVVDEVTKAVKDATGSDQAADAQKAIEADPAVEKELRIRLAEIAAEEEAKQREDELKAQELRMQEAEQRHKAEMEALKARQDDDFRRLEASIADTQAARSVFTNLARARNPFAWGPVVVSVVVAFGYFAILGILVTNWFNPTGLPLQNEVSQIVNIAIGALTAGFATVISFWLGSSQGSRNKDLASAELQSQATRESTRIIERQAQQSEVILKDVTARAEAKDDKTKPSNARRCIDIILEKEGGYVDHPSDPGGATNMGITFNTLKAWRGADISKQDVKDLTVEEARAIYETNYWKPLNCDDLAAGVDLVVFDFGVNAGPSRSAKLLQRVCGANQDGVVGPITIAAVKTMEPEQAIRRFGELRLEYYRSLKTWDTFGRGWTRRTEEVQRAALGMVAK